MPNSWKKAKLMEKGLNSRKRFNLSTKKRFPAPLPAPIYKMGMTSIVWNISAGQLGLAAQLCSLPALVHLLIS